ncbi:MAG: ABC transporter ATP-binding protein [Clostridia bacterium]|nr:ABC transporter ATP-binding protein [Clostridia bacterium]
MFLKRFKNLCAFKPYYKKHLKLIIALLSVMLIASSAGVFMSYLMSEQLIGITSGIAKTAIRFTIYVLAVVTIHHINWFLWSKFAYTLSKKVSADIKKDIVSNLLNTKYSAIKENGSGYYLERLNDDVNEISAFVGNVAGTLVDVFTNFGFLVIIYILSWQCGLFFTIGVALLFMIESIKVNADLKNLELVKKSTEKANSEFNEIIYGIKDIKGFGVKAEINNKMSKSNNDLLEKTYKKNTKFELISRIATYTQWVIDSVLVFMSMLWLLPTGQIEIVTLLLIFNYKSLMYDTVGFFSKLKGYYVNGNYYAKRVLEIIDTPNKEEFGEFTNTFNQGKITIKNLTFAYDEKKILDNINLELQPNSLNVLVGSSGSGKSTLFLLLSKLYEVDNGKIFFDDVDINDIAEKSFRENVCIVNQEPFIFSDTILNNIKIVKPNATLEEIENACKLANIHEEIISFENEYNTILTENGTNLSGGQKQRIEIARAILKNSKIICLDEPTSALDSENQTKLFKTLTELKQHKTIFVIAHKLNNYDCFDNVYELKNGKINKI